MASSVVTVLKEYGCDTEAALARFINNEGLYVKFLDKFLADDSLDQAREAIEAGDNEAALKAVHTLKGVAGNLGFTALYDLSAYMVNKYREGDPTEASSHFSELVKLHQDIIDIIVNNK